MCISIRPTSAMPNSLTGRVMHQAAAPQWQRCGGSATSLRLANQHMRHSRQCCSMLARAAAPDTAARGCCLQPQSCISANSMQMGSSRQTCHILHLHSFTAAGGGGSGSSRWYIRGSCTSSSFGSNTSHGNGSQYMIGSCTSGGFGGSTSHLRGMQQLHPGSASRSRRRLHSTRTVAKARPPRMRGQTCDLAAKPRSTELPAVDWRRYHLNVLFVDRYVPSLNTLESRKRG